jgi:hypothetical protein
MHGFGMLEFIAIAILVLFILMPFVLFIWALADILKSEFKDSNNRIVWLIFVLLVPMVGAILYLVIGRKQKVISSE